MKQLPLGAGVAVSAWDEMKDNYKKNKLPAGSLLGDLELIIRMACLIEDRSTQEHNALLRQARRLDRERNECVAGNSMWDQPGSVYAMSTGPLSDVESIVRETREL